MFNLNTKRKAIVFWSPSIVLFVFLITNLWQSDSFITRLLYSVIFALVLQTVGFIAYYALVAFVAYLTGNKEEKSLYEFRTEHLIAAIMLGAVVWIAWQMSVNNRIESLKECMNDYKSELRDYEKPGDFLEFCEDTIADQSSDDYNDL